MAELLIGVLVLVFALYPLLWVLLKALHRLHDGVARLSDANERRLDALRATLEDQLRRLQQDSGAHLERMRATVEEKLQSTLERRLGESFRHVSERLELVHKGLGEMQALATGVGDLKRVLTNVKTRGTWGEVQLEALLSQLLAPNQFDKNVSVKDGSMEVVEFALRLPGSAGESVYLPIDSKFPLDHYERLVDAEAAGDSAASASARRALEQRLKASAKEIAAKYIHPPRTTDFAILFVPTEGLFAEAARRVELIDGLQREHRVVVAGPTTLAALLNSLQMGFRTLAVQQRSTEVWRLLGTVKTEFGIFGDLLEGVQRKLDQASATMEKAAGRSRAIERRLRDVESPPAERPELTGPDLLALGAASD
jgi:DNA recombination protein RmuC